MGQEKKTTRFVPPDCCGFFKGRQRAPREKKPIPQWIEEKSWRNQRYKWGPSNERHLVIGKEVFSAWYSCQVRAMEPGGPTTIRCAWLVVLVPGCWPLEDWEGTYPLVQVPGYVQEDGRRRESEGDEGGGLASLNDVLLLAPTSEVAVRRWKWLRWRMINKIYGGNRRTLRRSFGGMCEVLKLRTWKLSKGRFEMVKLGLARRQNASRTKKDF